MERDLVSLALTPFDGRRHAPTSCPVDHANLMTQKVYGGIQVDICKAH